MEEILIGLLEFADGIRKVPVKRMNRERYDEWNIRSNHIQIVKRNSLLLEYAATYNHSILPERDSPQANELASICDTIVRGIEGTNISTNQSMQVGNMITRNGIVKKANAAFTNTVHRDFDETAVENLSARGFKRYFNVWIPFCKLSKHDYPLAFLNTSTFSKDDVAGFKNLEYDRTGIKWNEAQEWFCFDELDVGDCIVWESDVVFHGALNIPKPQTKPTACIDTKDHSMTQESDIPCPQHVKDTELPIIDDSGRASNSAQGCTLSLNSIGNPQRISVDVRLFYTE